MDRRDHRLGAHRVLAFLNVLSEDYEVFLLSLIREEHDVGHDIDEATVRGIARTGRLVTSAAAFISLSRVPDLSRFSDTDVKILATALALGIIIDAAIVGGILAPALVAALGDASWWRLRRRVAPDSSDSDLNERAVVPPASPGPLSQRWW